MERLIAALQSASSTVVLHLAAASVAHVLCLETCEGHLAKAQLLAPGQAMPEVGVICERIRSNSKLDESED